MGNTESVLDVSVNENFSKIASARSDGTVCISDVNERTSIIIPIHTGNVTSVRFTPDGHNIVSASDDCTICIINIETNTITRILRGHTNSVKSIAISSDGRKIVSGSADGSVRVWDIETGEVLLVMCRSNDYVRSVDITPDDKKIVSASIDGKICIWDMDTGILQNTIQVHDKAIGSPHDTAVTAVSVSKDGKKVVSASRDQTVRIFNIESGNIDFISQKYGTTVLSAALNKKGDTLLAGTVGCDIFFTDLRTGVVECLGGHIGHVTSVVFTDKGFVSGSRDSSVKIWKNM